jgi:O-antigen/teichoic acid export membrane protein
MQPTSKPNQKGISSLLVTAFAAQIQTVFQYCLSLTGKDGAWLMLGRFILVVNAFFLSIFLVRRFGLSAVGTYTIANVAVTFLALFCELGLSYSLPRESLSNDQRNMVVLVWTLFLVTPAAMSIGLYSWLMAATQIEFWEIALFATGGFFAGITNLTNILFLFQNRTRFSMIFPACNTLGIVAGVSLARSVIELALALLILRSVGNLLSFVLLKYMRVDAATVLRCGVRGLEYLPSELFALLSEQSGPIILSRFLSRGDLGLFGLCRQILTAADVPSWSFVQSKYPKLVETRLKVAREVARQNLRISLLVVLMAMGLSFLLAYHIFRLPQLFSLMCVLTLVLPFRYNNHFFDRVIKSQGMIRLNTSLSMAKFLFAIPLFILSAKIYGLWGGVAGLGFLSVFSDFLYRKPAQRLYLKQW